VLVQIPLVGSGPEANRQEATLAKATCRLSRNQKVEQPARPAWFSCIPQNCRTVLCGGYVAWRAEQNTTTCGADCVAAIH